MKMASCYQLNTPGTGYYLGCPESQQDEEESQNQGNAEPGVE
jgi:hypothetical protein